MSAGQKHAPFCWQEKAVLRQIRQECPKYGPTLAIYHALTEVASDKQSDTFQTTHEWISNLAGFSTRTVIRRLPELVRLGLIQITASALKAPATYRLVRAGTRSFRCDSESQRCDTERPSASRTSEEREESKESVPSQFTDSEAELLLEAQR
jgi:hypothetical protein